ncbi:MAG TPA: class II aldolase/adducin family protein [Stellaceae bacterium]|nr:class II aldolase/adducin family protein [Stellaceae bacterium]
MTPTASQVLPLKPLRSRVSEAEWQARLDLAAAYRLCDLYGMSDMIYTHISVRVPDAPGQFLLNPHGLLFDEVTASSLLKVDLDGNVLEQPEGPYGLHQAGFVIHSALYRARPDVNGAMHTHTIAGMAVSALKCGLLPLTQTATRFCSRLAYHDFSGPERDPNERDALARDLGTMNYMILRNHGLLTVGATIAEAFAAMYGIERSCQAQIAAMACNTALNEMPSGIVAKSIGMYDPAVIRRYGLLEWPGLLRKLDRKDPSWRD